MKLVRVYTGDDNESHFDVQSLDFGETGRTRPGWGTRSAEEPALEGPVRVSFSVEQASGGIELHDGDSREG